MAEGDTGRLVKAKKATQPNNIITMACTSSSPLIGVLALQGAFDEHQQCLEAVGCRTIQVRTPQELIGIDGIVLPGGESTAMGLIGTSSGGGDLWKSLQQFDKPTWGTCAGMILLAEKCVGASAVIAQGQALIGGLKVLVCRNYFGSQISSFEMPTPGPPNSKEDFPGVFIRAPAILSVGPNVEVLGKVVATPCRQAAVVLQQLDEKLERGEQVAVMGVVDALERNAHGLEYKEVVQNEAEEEKKDSQLEEIPIELPGASHGTNAREVICAVKQDKLLCTAFHPELTTDYRWHSYFADMVRKDMEDIKKS